MKKLCTLLTCLVGGALFAESIGKIEFEFPPSAYDWVLLNEYNTDKIQVATDLSIPCSFKVYTHKVGDALELFTAVWIDESSDGETTIWADEDAEEELSDEAEELYIPQFFQTIINQELASYFPNHRVVITKLEQSADAGFIEWEIQDGVQPILHGLARFCGVEGKGILFFSYFTTAEKSDLNNAFWMDILNQTQMQAQIRKG